MKTNKQKNTTQKNTMNFNCFLLQAAFQLSRIKMTQDTMKKKEIQNQGWILIALENYFMGIFFKPKKPQEKRQTS